MESASTSIVLFSAILSVLLAIVHIFSGKLRFLRSTPRNRWLSFGSGISVAYVFIHILPELDNYQEAIRDSIAAQIAFLEHHVYLLALLGLAVFYALERSAKESRQHNQKAGGQDVTTAGVFWIHMASFAAYNALIGYLLLHVSKLGCSAFSSLQVQWQYILWSTITGYGRIISTSMTELDDGF
jgi:hypothetical protein